MGLDTSFDAWNGPYSAFNRWRDTLAHVAGYPLVEVAMDYAGNKRAAPNIDWESVTFDNLEGDWTASGTPSDPLIILIAHYDCQGYILPEYCGILADRLEELLPAIEEDPFPTRDWMISKTEQFIKGLREAEELDQPVDFF